jgi:hypothetical protein
MQITFDLPHVFVPGSTPEENAPVLKAMLECLISVNSAYRKTNPACLPLYQSGVVYGRTVWWQSIPALYLAGKGDCKSLSAALISEYRQHGIEAKPVFRWIRKPNGVSDFHILVLTPRGFEDPSKVLGMGSNENARY